MGSTFFGLEIAKTGLHYNQKALDVTAHNIANAETEGYSRQRINSSSIDPYSADSLVAPLTNALVGSGVKIDTVQQIRNLFLDRQYRNESSLMGEWSVKSDVLNYIESLFAEPSDTGIMNAIDSFFVGMQELASNVGSKDVRTNFLQQAISLTETIKHFDRQLVQLQEEQDYAFTTSVNQVNEIVANIVSLNESIAKYELGGNTANDLRDKRNVLLDTLSEFTNITYSETKVGNENRLSVNIVTLDSSGNKQEINLINHNTSSKFDLYKKANSSFNSISINGQPLDQFTSGKLKGYLEMRDGNSDSIKGIQYFKDKLDTFAQSLVTSINDVHRKGFTFPSGGNASQNNINFFDPTGVTASTIKVDNAIINNVFNIAASDKQVINSNNTGNNKNILDMITLREKASIGGTNNFETYMSSYVAELGIEASYSNNMYINEGRLLDSVQTQRASISGVSLDEEMANMVRFEKSYQASARLITAMDEMLDVLINRTGVVGR